MAAKKKSIHTTPKGWGITDNPISKFAAQADKKTRVGFLAKTVMGTGKSILKAGDVAADITGIHPSRGAKSVAINSALLFGPYGKAFKGVDKLVKGGRVLESAVTAGRAAKGVKAIKVAKGVKAGAGALGKKTVRGALKYGVLEGTGIAGGKLEGKKRNVKVRKK